MTHKALFALATCIFVANSSDAAPRLGLDRESYGVFDRSGYHTIEDFPFVVGQEFQTAWEHVHPARNVYDWSALDAHLQFAKEQNQKLFVKVSPVGGSGGPPAWIYSQGVPQTTDGVYTYGYYLDDDYKTYHSEMILSLGNHLRNSVPSELQGLIAFVRVDTGATGDESPYEEAENVPSQYQITDQQWQQFRLWLFNVYDQAFQEGQGYKIPLLFQAVKPVDYPVEWNWCVANIQDGLGVKFGGSVRGHHLDQSSEIEISYKDLAVDSSVGLFSRNEMDQTWSKPFFQLNVRLGLYWAAIEQLHAGMSVWDVTSSALENTYVDNTLFAYEFFNKWAAELVPTTAGGGFLVFHEGLDSADTDKFSEGTFGTASKGNVERYNSICAAFSPQSAQMDHPEAATHGQVWQRSNQDGYNDAGWRIVTGNYERFIAQIDPDNTSIGLWRVGGPLNAASHPYSRFARGFQSSSGRNTMYFDVHDDLVPQGQPVQVSVTYYDAGTGMFELQYDAKGDSQKSAFTVVKTNTMTWKTESIVLTDVLFGNHGPNGADLVLQNLDGDDDIFHMVEVLKLVNVNIGTVGIGSVLATHDTTTYDPPSGVYMEGTRLHLIATPAQGWEFSSWSGDIVGTSEFARLYPTASTRVTATFSFTGLYSSSDDFESNSWSGGEGWSGQWNLQGGTVLTVYGQNVAIELTSDGQMTRTLSMPLSAATLEFDWDVDRVDAGESAQAEIYDGAWHVVWIKTDADNGDDSGGNPDALVSESVDLDSFGTVSQVRFTLNAGGSADRIWIDNVRIRGYVTSGTNIPIFSSDPIVGANALESSSYSGSIASSASDPNGDMLTFSKVSGPTWLSVASDGALSGTPGPADAGENAFTVQVDDGIHGTDDAILVIVVDEINSAPVFVADPFSKADAFEGAGYFGSIAKDAYDPNIADTLTYSKHSGPSWLSATSDGSLSGTPGAGDVGMNVFSVNVQDNHGASITATMKIAVLSANPGSSTTAAPTVSPTSSPVITTTTSFEPTDDTWVTSSSTSANKGSKGYLRVRDSGNKIRDSYLKFEVQGLSGTVISASLRLYSIDVAQTVHCNQVDDSSWTEGTMTWNNKPTMGASIGSVICSANTWCEWDVMSYVTGDGTYSFGLRGSAGADDFSSKEGSNPPELVIVFSY